MQDDEVVAADESEASPLTDSERLMLEAEARATRAREDHRVRTEMLVEWLPAPPDDAVVLDASERGMQLIDVIEATADLSYVGPWPKGRLISPADAYVRLPRGYATVEFLRMLFAVSG